MATDREPIIIIEGKQLTNAQAATVRVAIEHFATDLQQDGLGDDDTGKAITAAYLARIREIRGIIFA